MSDLDEEQLGRLPTAELVRMIREQQRLIDNLQLSRDVALRDRDELRAELLRCRQGRS